MNKSISLSSTGSFLGTALSVLTIFSCLVGQVTAQTGTDPNQPDTVYVDSVIAFRTGKGVVPVSFVNDENLTSATVTLRHQISAVKIDSFSFAGGRFDQGFSSNNFAINDDSNIVYAAAVLSGTNLLSPGQGLFGKVYYSYSQSITPQVVPIDSFTWALPDLRVFTTEFGSEDNQFDTYIPQFVKGYLDIQQAPATFDSLWVDRIEGEPDQPVTVDVFSYNERELSELKLVLDFGSSALHYDSVSFVGGRGASATSKTIQGSQTNHNLIVTLGFGSIAPLATGTGKLATLHFTVADTAVEGIRNIDTVTVPPTTKTRYVLTPLNGSLPIYPLFTKGWVDVKVTTGIEDITPEGELPTEYTLSQNYPNPFNPSTNIEFSLPAAGDVRIDILNILGQKVRRLVNEQLPAGVHRVVFDGKNDGGKKVASGVYFYRIKAGDYENSKKMMLLK